MESLEDTILTVLCLNYDLAKGRLNSFSSLSARQKQLGEIRQEIWKLPGEMESLIFCFSLDLFYSLQFYINFCINGFP